MDTQKDKILKFAGFTTVWLMAICIVVVIVMISLAFTCTWPFGSLLARCVAPVSSNPICDKNSLCLDKCQGDEYREITCKKCAINEQLVDGKCIPLCGEGEIYNGVNCVKIPCGGTGILANNRCIPDIDGYYDEFDINGKITGKYRILAPKTPFGLYQARVKLQNQYIDFKPTPDYNGIVLSYRGGLSSTEYTDKEIKWDNGSKWVKTGDDGFDG